MLNSTSIKDARNYPLRAHKIWQIEQVPIYRVTLVCKFTIHFLEQCACILSLVKVLEDFDMEQLCDKRVKGELIGEHDKGQRLSLIHI